MNSSWALLRIATSQLPIGGYSYSQGLEWAIESQHVKDSATASIWLSDQMMLNLGRFEGPLLFKLCHAAQEGDWSALAHFSEQHRASRETYELHAESQQMGYSLIQLLSGISELDQEAHSFLDQQKEVHFALAWAIAARAWQIAPKDAVMAWLWTWFENQLSVMMKALPLGQQAAQKITSQLLPILDQALQQILTLDIQQIGSAPFGLILSSIKHEQQYSRLFRS